MEQENLKEKSQYHVLVVDDLPKNLQVVGNILLKINITPYFSTSGIHALEFLEKNTPDLILLDISMPEMDGFEVCEKIKKNPRTAEVPVIFLTARNQPEEILKGFDLGAVDYITKPFNQGELIRRVSTHLKLKQALEVILEQNQELVQLNSLKDRMFSIIGHDLRGPMSTFQSVIEMILEHPEEQELNIASLSDLKTSALQSYYLLDNLLNWSLSQQNNLVVKKEIFPIQKKITSTLHLLASQASCKELHISTKIDKDLQVYADLQMISAVFRNLISNAIKFTPHKGEIHISATKENNKIKVLIEDYGLGIPKEAQKKIFDPKEIYITHGTDLEKGSGLGLKLCKEFIEKNDGEIWVESEPGQGSKFYFTLPVN